MLRVLAFLAVLLAGIYLLGQYLRLTGMFFPDRYPTGRWDTDAWMVTPEEHWFTTRDRVRLHAWLFRAERPGAPVLVWFHGNAGNLTDRAEMAVELAKRGTSVFVFDYRGFGRSAGRARESKLFLDGEAAFDHVRDTVAGPAGSPIVLYGESIGGPYAAWVAREREGVRGVILENSFPSLREVANAIYAPLPLGWMAPLALRTADWLNDAGVPVLVMHGTRDAVIPYHLGRSLFERLEVPKSMLTSNAGHCEIPLFDADRYYAAVTRFVEDSAGPGAEPALPDAGR